MPETALKKIALWFAVYGKTEGTYIDTHIHIHAHLSTHTPPYSLSYTSHAHTYTAAAGNNGAAVR